MASSAWAIRILTGPQAGQIVPLDMGYNIVGRSPSCKVKVAANGVSKEHATVLVTEDGKLLITDMKSRNGTFVNGLRVQNQRLGAGDKISFHEVVCDILKLPPGYDPRYRNSGSMPAWAGNVALQSQPALGLGPSFDPGFSGAPQYAGEIRGAAPQLSVASAPEASVVAGSVVRPSSGNVIVDLWENLKLYVEHVAMPGIYMLVQKMSFRQGLLLFVAAYVVLVTMIATIPMVRMTQNSIKLESTRRAKTIARNLAAINRQAILESREEVISVRLGELEEGVSNVLILSAEGTVMAPANKKGEFSKLPFVNQARQEARESVGAISASEFGVAVPILKYSPDTGSQEAVAYSIVLYDMGQMAMKGNQILALFMQIFMLATLIGGLLYFFLIRVVEHPLHILGLQLDDALREGRDDLATPYNFPQLEKLVANVNSALTRAANGGGPSANGGAAVNLNRETEAINIVRMLPIPAISINALDDRIVTTNGFFDSLIGGGMNLTSRPVTDIPDAALKQQLADLIPQMRGQLGQIAFGELPFGGEIYEINGQSILGTPSEPAWFLITMHKKEGG
jgi:hypothetical protein